MTRWCLLFLFVCLISGSLLSQGKLLLIGGGEEAAGSWSDDPYRWAIQQSGNQRVAIISYIEEGDALADYLESLGASDARNFWIADPKLARTDWLLDSLASYDCLLIRGEDPFICNQYYRGTVIETALTQAYQRGAVVGGHSKAMTLFGDRFFSARLGDQSAQGLTNLWAPPYSLEKGLIGPYEGFIFEAEFNSSHSLDRLLGFMARSRVAATYRLDGIGIASNTAFGIEQGGMGTVWGEGDVWVILDDWDQRSFRPSGAGATIDSLRVLRLLDGQQFDVVSWEVKGMEENVPATSGPTNLPGRLFLHGMNDLSEYESLFQHIKESGGSNKLVLISQSRTARFEAIQALLISRGMEILPLLIRDELQSSSQLEISNYLGETQFLFIDNAPDSLDLFLSRHELGSQLPKSMTQQEVLVGIMGTDATWVPQQLGFLPNWQLLPPAYSSQEVEAWKSSLLQLGPGNGGGFLVLPSTAWIQIERNQNGVSISNQGEGHGLLLTFAGAQWGMVHRDESSPTTSFGFREAHLTAIGERPFLLFKPENPRPPMTQSSTPAQMMVFPNPIKDRIHILLPGDQEGLYFFQLVDGQGKQLISHRQYLRPTDPFIEIPAGEIPPGVYVLQIQQGEKGNIQSIQVLR